MNSALVFIDLKAKSLKCGEALNSFKPNYNGNIMVAQVMTRGKVKSKLINKGYPQLTTNCCFCIAPHSTVVYAVRVGSSSTKWRLVNNLNYLLKI
jgi:hypothetical protein